jgi:hypothetical protein
LSTDAAGSKVRGTRPAAVPVPAIPVPAIPAAAVRSPGYGAVQAFGFQGMAAYAGMPFMGNPFGGGWQQQQGDGTTTRQPIRFPATLLPVQPYEVEAAYAWVVNCWPEPATDRIQGVFSIAQSGEILTVQAPRDGEDWMRLNPCQEEQRWSALNVQIAVLSSSKVAADRTTLEQFES